MTPLLAVVAIQSGGPNLPLQAALERALQGISIHGREFRSTVEGVASQYPRLFGESMWYFDYQHPLGWRDSTLVTMGVGRIDNLSFIVFKQGACTRVESLNTEEEMKEGSYLPGLAAWSGSHLCEFLRFRGGTGNTDEARVFRLNRGKWQLEKRLEAFGENAWEGELSHQTIVRSNPVDICDSLVVRRPPAGKEDNLGHSDIWFDYRQEWHFKDGRLRQTTFYRLRTPGVATYELLSMVKRRHRDAFNQRVSAGLRNRLWRELLNLSDAAVYPGADDSKRDESPELSVGMVLPVGWSKVNGKWMVTEVGTPTDPW